MAEEHWRRVRVNANGAGQRVDTWLARRFGNWSRSAVARLIAEGEIRGEGRELKPSSILVPGEHLLVHMPEEHPGGPPPPMPPVLHEDDRLLVVHKPPGMLCHPAGRRYVHAVVGLVREARPDHHVDLAHRLDRDTSGVLALTKDARANVFLKRRFKSGQGMAKEYLAITRGVIPWEQRVIDAPIGSAIDSEVRIRRGVNLAGREAQTEVAVVQRLDGFSLVACRLLTGRTHQIRVHLEHVGFPVLGDKLYGQPDRVFLHHLDHGDDDAVRAAVGFPRHCLHAARAVLPHPDGHEVVVEAPLPADMAAIVAGEAPCWPTPSE